MCRARGWVLAAPSPASPYPLSRLLAVTGGGLQPAAARQQPLRLGHRQRGDPTLLVCQLIDHQPLISSTLDPETVTQSFACCTD